VWSFGVAWERRDDVAILTIVHDLERRAAEFNDVFFLGAESRQQYGPTRADIAPNRTQAGNVEDESVALAGARNHMGFF
jgi:hypothetical protein